MTPVSGPFGEIRGANPIIQQFFSVGPRGLFTPSVILPTPISSPPRHDGSDNRNLTYYIKWLIQKYPAQQAQLYTVGEKLQNNS
jgi:hypothetical protein